ncbi:hypothetical protein ACTOB_007548 [Actinoplanes oblitus]|uniref:Flavin reductase n=1 Tax=Actinoplanes oblitus TaxID=3040509 RepID=A0ABY8WC35_9ACTN|nr:hypothetical protein [Actinoplanes oblitus]WIM95439.1 hypothetical protein ACTOB_007548 [Actinoplanes oblitus]
MTSAQEVEHLHQRPDWDCLACGSPWPCAIARGKLLHEYRAFPSLLRIYLSTQMYEALQDMTAAGEAPQVNLYERFLAWARSSPSSS